MEGHAIVPNTFADEIVIHDKNRFYPKLDNASIQSLTDIFCVDSMDKTRCFSVGMRPVRLTQKGREWAGISHDDYTIHDINTLLKGKNLAVVRSDKSNKEKYVIQECKFEKIETLMAGYPYDHTYLNIEFNGEIEEKISLRRVFMPTSEVVK